MISPDTNVLFHALHVRGPLHHSACRFLLEHAADRDFDAFGFARVWDALGEG